MEAIDNLTRGQKEAYLYAAALCSKWERCSSQIRQKMKGRDLSAEAMDTVIELLKQEKFIDDLRFASGYVQDKVRLNKWGKTKIVFHLRELRINENQIGEALQRIDGDLYRSNLRRLLAEKQKTVLDYSPLEQKARLYRFAAGRGYESDLIMKILEQLFTDH